MCFVMEKILYRGALLSQSFSLAETLGKQKTRKGQIYVFICFLFKDVINNHNCLGGHSLRLHPTALCSYTPGGFLIGRPKKFFFLLASSTRGASFFSKNIATNICFSIINNKSVQAATLNFRGILG